MTPETITNVLVWIKLGLGIIAAILAQTVVLGTFLWKLASWVQRLETTLVDLKDYVANDINERLLRLESSAVRK